ncbi:MAG: PLP-dependent aspartate aminotransferase family protein [Hyphomonadaceae bacterium]
MAHVRLETLALHAPKRPHDLGAPVAPPIVPSNSFYSEMGGVGFSGVNMTQDMPAFYSRWGGPTVALLEQRMAALEGGEAGVCFASGMGAIAAIFLSQLRTGDHLVMTDTCYAGAAELARELRDSGIDVTGVNCSNLDEVQAAMTPKTRLVYIETPANPIYRLTDVAAVAEIAHAGGAKLVVDSTVATPIGARPLSLGADFVVHSLSKYACGHGDALGGAVIGGGADIFAMRKHALVHHGAVMSAFTAWLILRGLETLPLRMARHQDNARRVASYLESHKRIDRVFWPGLESHPQHALAKQQMSNFSGMLAFRARDAEALAHAMSRKLQVISYAVSLGHTKSLLIYIPTDTLLQTSFVWGEASAASYRDWIGDGAFRFSVGIEDPDDLIADLEQALAP